MHPAERLRAVVRWSGDDALLAAEAAGALAAFAEQEDPAGLVVACRRLLAYHPGNGALWWTCARVLAAPDAASAARESAALLDADRTGERLGATLPLVDPDRVVAVAGRSPALDEALRSRADLAVFAVRARYDDPSDAAAHYRGAGDAFTARAVEPHDLSGMPVALLLVVANALGGGQALVARGVGDALVAAGNRPEVWLVAGVGVTLPARLAEALRTASAASAGLDRRLESVSLDRFDRVAGPRGLDAPAEAEARADCPVPPELLRPL